MGRDHTVTDEDVTVHYLYCAMTVYNSSPCVWSEEGESAFYS